MSSLNDTVSKLGRHLASQNLAPQGLTGTALLTLASLTMVDKGGRQVIAVDEDGVVSFPLSGVTAASDTTITGTLGVTGATTLGDDVAITGDLALATNKFTVASASGNTAVAGTLAVTGASTLTGNVSAGGTLAVTGLSTFTGGFKVGTQALSGAGAANVTTGTTKLTTTGAGNAITLADGADGQIKTIIHDVDGGSAVLTPSTKTGFTTITFTNVGETAMLQFVTTRGWVILALNGAVAA